MFHNKQVLDRPIFKQYPDIGKKSGIGPSLVGK